MSEEEQKTAEQPATTPAGDTPPATGLSVGDLQNIAMIFDVASRRGAFKADEMQTVGTVYNKLKTFLDSLPKPEGEPAPTPQQPATEMPANAPAIEPQGENK
jgi:hypothetical protein|tara:strand:- start:1578 stop:1883 length:306 start_codon:yes stop_codon:yes gene_type:complete